MTAVMVRLEILPEIVRGPISPAEIADIHPAVAVDGHRVEAMGILPLAPFSRAAVADLE